MATAQSLPAMATAATAAAAAAAVALSCCHGRHASAPGPPVFIPAAGFDGAKAGYVFQNGVHGVGYYWDAPQTAGLTANEPALPSSESDEDDKEPDLAPVPVMAKLTPPAPEPEPEQPEPPSEPEFIRPADVPIKSWPRERIADGALALTLYYLRGSLPELLRKYPVPALTEAIQSQLADDRARMAVLILAQPEEDGAGLFSTLALDAVSQEENRPKSAIKHRRKVRSGGVNRGQLEVEGHFDEDSANKGAVFEGAESFLSALSAVPYNVSFEYRKEFAILLEAAGSPDLADGFGAMSVPLPGEGTGTDGNGGALLRAVHLLGLCDPIEPPRPGAAAAIIRLAAKDWVELTNVKSYLADTEHKIVKADSGGKVTGGNDEMY